MFHLDQRKSLTALLLLVALSAMSWSTYASMMPMQDHCGMTTAKALDETNADHCANAPLLTDATSCDADTCWCAQVVITSGGVQLQSHKPTSWAFHQNDPMPEAPPYFEERPPK